MNTPMTDEEYARFVKVWDWADVGAVPLPLAVGTTEAGASLTEDNTRGSARPDPAPAAPEQGALL